MTKLRNSHGEKKTQVVTKLILWQNSNCYQTQVVTKLKLWQNLNWQNSYCEEEKNSKTQYVT